MEDVEKNNILIIIKSHLAQFYHNHCNYKLQDVVMKMSLIIFVGFM